MADENGFNIIDQLNQRGGQQKTDASTSTTDFRGVWEKATQQELRYLQSIDKNIEELLKKGGTGSQSSVFDSLSSRRDERDADKLNKARKAREDSGRTRWDGKTGGRDRGRLSSNPLKKLYDQADEMFEEFSDSLEESLWEAAGGTAFGKKIEAALNDLSDTLGVSIEDVGTESAHILGKQVADKIQKSPIGSGILGQFGAKLNKFGTGFAQHASQTRNRVAGYSEEQATRIYKNQFFRAAQGSVDFKEPATETPSGTAQGVAASQSAQGSSFSAQVVAIQADMVQLNALSVERKAEDAAEAAGDVLQQAAESSQSSTYALKGSDLVDSKTDIGSTTGDAAEDGAKALVSAGGEMASQGATDLVSQGASAALGAAGIPIPPELIALLVKPLMDALLAPILAQFDKVAEKFGDVTESVSNALFRTTKSAEKNQEYAQKRLEADVKSLIEAPFEIAKDAAEEMYQVWDNNLRKINATQGYDKAGLQSLIGAYAERLRSEGLTSAIGADDITENLSKVLETGMSGAIAEEFAYLATKLNAAIPTEDFFNYAATYSSVASQAMAAGMSQTEAISHANEQLEAFANNILYASRELSGGFTTGLANANDLFAKSTQIAQAAKVDNSTGISAVLTAVSSIAGAVAPDLANGLIEAVYSAAVGGNNSSIVALRSLAGINASNTEFLRQLATNPQRVFGDLFEGLGRMQSMSDDNYMEVAEALSDTFGVSMDAIARVDFNYLASAIRDMNAGSSALQQNIAHLASGETTTSAEAMRMQQINEYMLEEGLAYVLDNEVARQIQQHMWDEQIARELMEARYSVDLVGSSLAFLQSIMSAVDTIMTILNPFRLLSKIGDLIATGAEASAQKADIRETLLLGKVGQGRASDFYNLTTRNADLELFNSYVSKQGGFSHYEAVGNLNALGKTVLAGMTGVFGDFDIGTNGVIAGLSKGLLDLGQRAAGSLIGGSRKPGSAYSWGQLGKSAASAISGTSYATNAALALAGSNAAQTSASTAAAQTAANDKLMKLLDTEFLQEKFVSQGKSYEDWVKYAKASGFSDIDAALSSAGLSAEDVKGQFNAIAGQEGSRIAEEDEKKQREMWEIVTFNLPLVEAYLKAQKEYQERFEVSWNDEIKWVHDTWELHSIWLTERFNERTTQIDTKTTEIIAAIDRGIAKQDEMIQLNKTFFKSMTDNFLGAEGMTYSGAGIKYDEVNKIKKAEADEQSSAIYKLAEALTANTVDLTNPVVAQNAMIAQILKLVEIIVTQNSGAGGGTTIADSLIGLALGYTAPTA